LNEWNISHKLISITTDGGSNMKVGANLLGCQWFNCIAHKLHNAIKHVIEPVEEIQTKGRALVKHFKQSALSYSKLG
jgi:hypothetical protein